MQGKLTMDDFLGQLRRKLLTPRAVAQRNRHRAFRASLPHDVLVELGDNLTRGQRFHSRGRRFRQVDGHVPAGKLFQKLRQVIRAIRVPW